MSEFIISKIVKDICNAASFEEAYSKYYLSMPLLRDYKVRCR